jgi:outer membrane protein assembly factor BamB
MFRGTPDHTSFIDSKEKRLFTAENWMFNASSPIRSSAAYDQDHVYFGTSKGVFYALNKQNGHLFWKFETGYAINSSPCLFKSTVFFSDNKQTLYALNIQTGKLVWKFDFSTNREYPWAFDYYYSSPTIFNNRLLIGAKDGFVYKIDLATGKPLWKFKTEGIVRSTPSIKDNMVVFGDTEGILYAIRFNDGKELWRFHSQGFHLKNEDFGFDRKAFISSPVITGNKVLAGCRDGFLYAVNFNTGKEAWHIDHKVSWVISSVAVKDSIVVTGTSDGRFVQAVNLQTGKELWKFHTISIVWSSPVICNNEVYIGSQEGILYCLDLHDGKMISSFNASGKIFTSPAISDSLLFFGTDNGIFYALKSKEQKRESPARIKKYVYWQPDVSVYFTFGTDIRIRDLLINNRYTVIHSKEIQAVLKNTDSASQSLIVFASNYFPQNIMEGKDHSLLRTFLDAGGRIVIMGTNPVIYVTDTLNGMIKGFDFLRADSVLGIKFTYNDLRSMRGIQPAFPTVTGTRWGLQKFWTGFLPIKRDQADIILGMDEDGYASAWVKKYSQTKGSGFIQIWVDPEGSEDLGYIIKVAEHEE